MAKLGHEFLLANCNAGKRLSLSQVRLDRISNTISSNRPCPKNSRKKEHVGFVSGTTRDGRDFYAYVSLAPNKYEDLLLHFRAGEEVCLQRYGRVIRKGFGQEPPPEIKTAMERKYGMEKALKIISH